MLVCWAHTALWKSDKELVIQKAASLIWAADRLFLPLFCVQCNPQLRGSEVSRRSSSLCEYLQISLLNMLFSLLSDFCQYESYYSGMNFSSVIRGLLMWCLYLQTLGLALWNCQYFQSKVTALSSLTSIKWCEMSLHDCKWEKGRGGNPNLY